MSEPAAVKDQYEGDRALTLRNRARLEANRNLLYWYRELYRHQLRDYAEPERLKILEIGSGVSTLQRFHPNVLTSDVLELNYLDYTFDCHAIDRFEPIENGSLDVIALTNVLHHLQDPVGFLGKAAGKLKSGGKVIATEPYFSVLAQFIYKYVHHEPVDLEISAPVLAEVRGPLASANIALPWLIFIKHPEWNEVLREHFDFEAERFPVFSSLSYMITGGISRRLPIPGPLYGMLFHLDLAFSRRFPDLLASFFTITLTRK
jgi:SAM-dependent methyltransferase